MTPPTSTHDCEWAEAVLTGESPPLMGDLDGFEAEVARCPHCSALSDALLDIDALAADLPDLHVPAELSRRTLDAVLRELPPAPVAQAPKRQRWPAMVLVGSLTIAATTLLTVWPSGPTPAPPERLVARGSAVTLPSVTLKVAVDADHGLERHRLDHAYSPGTQLRFRVGLDLPADVALVRVSANQRQILTRTSLPSGDHDLTLDGAPLAWEIEAGEEDARFIVLAAPTGSLPTEPFLPLPADVGSNLDTPVCDHVTQLACDERPLKVLP